MAKMHFKYGSMNSGKSIDLMRTAHNYEENGYKVLIIKSETDTKGDNKISSRLGIEREVDIVLKKDDSVIFNIGNRINDVNCILVDEAQFLTTRQVDDLYIITKVFNIPVLCYGLRTNFRMETFEGSKRLLEVCEELEEIRTLCECGDIARYVGRKENGVFTLDGDEVVIDGSNKNVEYVPLCGECYLKKVKKLELDSLKRK